MSELALLWQTWGPVVLILILILWLGAAYWQARLRQPQRPKLHRGDTWGTVYVLWDQTHQNVVKVGYTSRLTKQRRAEVKRTMTHGAHLKTVFAADMPFAKTAETCAHRRLAHRRVRWGWGSRRGREWFAVSNGDDLVEVVQAVMDAAHETRVLAWQQGRWPHSADFSSRYWQLTKRGPKRGRLFGREVI